VRATLLPEEGGTAGGEGPAVEDVRIVSVLPAAPYLARLFSFSADELGVLFRGDELACAVRPCGLSELQSLLATCRSEIELGRQGTLFKHPRLLNLCGEISAYQGWKRGPQKAPSASVDMWESLLKLERRWLSDDNTVDGTLDEEERVTDGKKRKAAPDEDSAGTDGHRQLEFGGINVDPSLNLPDPTDTRRTSYIDERKRPQVLWMVDLICHLLHADDADDGRTLHLIDVGGGRGDLAIAVAACLAAQHRTAHVTVLDVNASSLSAGRERAAAAGLHGAMSFELLDVTERERVRDMFAGRRSALVFGLHCCGGLAEAAVDTAAALGCGFAVSTCCFRSNGGLAVLSELADASEPPGHVRDRDRAASLAVLVGATGQHRGIRVLNAMRLAAARNKWLAYGHKGVLRTWQESFPVKFSVQNRVMVGAVEDG